MYKLYHFDRSVKRLELCRARNPYGETILALLKKKKIGKKDMEMQIA